MRQQLFLTTASMVGSEVGFKFCMGETLLDVHVGETLEHV